MRATLELLAEAGFDATTMDEIAARAGVGKNTIYRRWSSKEELVIDAVRSLTAAADPGEHEDVRELLRAQIRATQEAYDDPSAGRVMPVVLGELHRNPQLASVWMERIIEPRRRLLVKRVRLAVRRGELRRGTDPNLVADLVLGPLLLRFLFPSAPKRSSPRYGDLLFDTIWAGIQPGRE